VFYDDIIAKHHCFNAFKYDKDKHLNIASQIACRMIMWARWLNALLDLEDEGLSRSHLYRAWIRQRLPLQSKLDELFVMDISSLEKKEEEMARMQVF